ncbi:uncharacterized protein LOC110728630 [Chenopodium quinoa]|uniref:uncharacterized protein LOC110728630 n=1 Tax=Chenopodium quinoa TaxID=63459 RepID=UPI000B771F40|nr:uncharacterized protein LOC110728630 [Chenopodium quinoa]
MSQEVALLAMQSGLLPGLAFREYMGRKNLKTLAEALGKAHEFIKGNETDRAMLARRTTSAKLGKRVKPGRAEAAGKAEPNSTRGDKSKEEEKDKEKRELEDVLVVSGGPVHGGTVRRARADLKDMVHQVNYNEHRKWPPPPPPQPKVVFDEKDQYGVIYPHDDSLLVAIPIENWKVRRVLVDGGSSANIMFIKAFHKMHLDSKDLKRVNYEVTRFDGSGTIPEGIIELSVQVGEGA